MFASFIQRAVMQGIPLLFGSTGEIITEKSGNLNLGIPGIMYVGGICGVIGSFFYEQSLPSADAINPFLAVLIPLLCSMLGSCIMGLIYSYRNSSRKPERNRSCAYHLRHRHRQLFRRLSYQAAGFRYAFHRPYRYQQLF